MRKFIVLPMAFILCAVMVTPSFAFSSDSFVIDTDPYLFESIQASSFSLRSTASTYSVSALSASDSVGSIPLNTTLPVMTDVPICTFYGESDYQGHIINFTPIFGDFNVLSSGSVVSNASVPKPDYSDYTWKTMKYPMTHFELVYDVSSLNSSCIQLNGTLKIQTECYWGKWYLSKGFDLNVYIDGDLQKSYYTQDSVLDFGGFVYDSPAPVQEIVFEFINIGALEVDIANSSATSGTVNVCIYGSSTASIDGLSDNDVLNSFNDKAQEDINAHESYEADYTSSMNSAFNALSLDSFTWHDGLVSAFSLISGIFTDLWNGMGIYAVLYTFPLFLAIVLLLIGRISKHAGTKSSGKNGDE